MKSAEGGLNKLSKLNRRNKKRLGRGLGSGRGGTSGRGTKGQKSRSGYNIPRRFEGGQTPLIARLPKSKGFTSISAKPYILNIQVVEKNFKDGDEVNLKTLKEKGLVKEKIKNIKILGPGKLTKKLKFRGVKLTKKLLAETRTLSAPKPTKTKINS